MGRKSDYGNGMYQQLQEIMGRLETVEKDSKQKIETLNKRIDTLEKENQNLKKENQLLRNVLIVKFSACKIAFFHQIKRRYSIN